jgi:hypothetical protein
VQLAADVKSILPDAKVSYAADWTEYFGHQPQDGSNDVYFHLDPLWSSPNIDFIGIDNYMPLSDWRDGRQHTDYLAGTRSINDIAYLKSNVAGGEGFDWYYAAQSDRDAQLRTTITDGANGKPWVYRFKDIGSWWLNPHYNRPSGSETTTPTAWVPQSKAIWFTEAGCPAVDKGTNSPNLFFDAKSSESAYPPYSNGQRDDFMQNRYLRAFQSYWNAGGAANPISSVYGGRMVDASRIFFWTWDARPFPAFPQLDSVWSDGPNYDKGHWLTGRLAAVDLGTLIAALAAKFGFADVDVDGVEGLVDGFVIDRPMSARDALEGLLETFAVDVFEQDGRLTFRSRKLATETTLDPGLYLDEQDRPLLQTTRSQETELPATLNMLYAESAHDYRSAAVTRKHASTQSRRETTIILPAAVPAYLAQSRADIALEEAWASRETAHFSLGLQALALMPGDVVQTPQGTWRVSSVTDGLARRVEAVAHATDIYESAHAPARKRQAVAPPVFGPPQLVLMDLATVTASSNNAPWIAAFAKPWPGSLALYRRTGAASFTFSRTLDARATLGTLLTPLPAGLTWRIDHTYAIDVELSYGALASVTEELLLNGENRAAIGTAATGFEIIQFQNAELIAPKRFRLTGLLRAQAGSFAEMQSLRPAGEAFVLLNQAVVQPALESSQQALPQTWRAGPPSSDYAHPSYREVTFDPALLPLRPLPPVQLRVARDAAGLRLSWIRQTRIDGDVWELTEVPLGEESELYTLNIMNGATIARSTAPTTPDFLYATADILTDFGTIPSSLDVRVAQVSATYGPGPFAQGTLNV